MDSHFVRLLVRAQGNLQADKEKWNTDKTLLKHCRCVNPRSSLKPIAQVHNSLTRVIAVLAIEDRKPLEGQIELARIL